MTLSVLLLTFTILPINSSGVERLDVLWSDWVKLRIAKSIPRLDEGGGIHVDRRGASQLVPKVGADCSAMLKHATPVDLVEYAKRVAKRYDVDPAWVLGGDLLANRFSSRDDLLQGLDAGPRSSAELNLIAAYDLYVERKTSHVWVNPPREGKVVRPRTMIKFGDRDMYPEDMTRSDLIEFIEEIEGLYL